MQAIKAEHPLNNQWIFSEGETEIARVHLPAAVTDEAGALAWWAAHGHELDPDYVPPPQPAEVHHERDRRLAEGFDYDFADARGVHRLATSDADMRGWREVTDIAQARLALADATPIVIATETGVVAVTPAEWMAVLEAAAAFRQPIWHASFALQAMDPIPADYATNAAYWTL